MSNDKLWDKGYDINREIEKFTVGNDYLIDLKLVEYDCLASIAHAKMLYKIKLLTKAELDSLIEGLNEIISLNQKKEFSIDLSDEDCHTAIEKFLTKKYGDVGKKIHTARSRNDQVLTALRLYEKHELKEIKKLLFNYEKSLKSLIVKKGKIAIPGYTHMQKAMPSSIGLWLGSFYDSIEDDSILLNAIENILDQSPLGTAAGYGVPVFDIDKNMTAKEMGFSKTLDNPIYAQLSRGKFESSIIHLLTQIMLDLNKLSSDLIMFSMTEFKFIELPKELCTGSSIMPQKKNPDVLELIRAKYSVLLGEEFKIKSMISNLISGYNRDLQLMKEPLFNSIDITKSCISMMILVLTNIKIDEENCKLAMTKELFATEEAYKLVKKGIPFREAYKKIGEKYS